MNDANYKTLLKDVQQCTICAEFLPLGPRPVFQIHPKAKILIAGQAPGLKVYHTGVPFDDASGSRLREWMGISKGIFYNPEMIAIMPMGFCYPGSGKSGDLPPRKECALKWRQTLLNLMSDISLILVIGQYAMDWHLKKAKKQNLTETVKSWKDYLPNAMPLPHPSPRNNIWLKKNPWFEAECLPYLKKKIFNLIRVD